MTQNDLDTLRSLLPACVAGAAFAIAVAVFVFTRAFATKPAESVSEEAYWGAFRRMAMVIAPFIASCFLVAAAGCLFVLFTQGPNDPYAPLRLSSSPLFDPTNQDFGIRNHPEAVVPWAIQFLIASSVWTLTLAGLYLGYFFYRYEMTPAPTLPLAPAAGWIDRILQIPERLISRIFGLALITVGRVLQFVLFRFPFIMLFAGVPFAIALTVVNHQTSVHPPELTTTLVLGPFIFAMAVILMSAQATGFVNYLRRRESVIGIYAVRDRPAETGTLVREVLVRSGSATDREVIPEHDGFLTLPCVYLESPLPHPTTQIAHDYVLKLIEGSSCRIERIVRDYPILWGFTNYRITILKALILTEEVTPAPANHQWWPATELMTSLEAHPDLRTIMRQDVIP